jgi:hypothetical protein
MPFAPIAQRTIQATKPKVRVRMNPIAAES